MGSSRATTPKIGFDEGEQREFARALKQQLMVQTPLQVLLETLFSRLQAQAQMFNELSRRVERLEARDLDGQELLHRLQLCEGKLSDITVSKLSPFNQQEVLARLDGLEKHVEESRQAAEAAPPVEEPSAPSAEESQAQDQSSSVEARLAAVEDKLSGVYNLTGKLIALEHMAEDLGIGVPDLEYNPGTNLDEFYASKATDEGHSGLAGLPVIELEKPQSSSRPVSTAGRGGKGGLLMVQGQKAGTAGGSRSNLGTPRGGEHSSRAESPAKLERERSESRNRGAAQVSELGSQLQEIAAETETLRMAVEALSTGLSQAQADIGLTHSSTSERLERLEASTAKSAEQLAQEIAAIKVQAKREPDVSFAEFSRLQSQVEAAAKEVKAATEAVEDVKDNDIKTLYEAIEDVREVHKKADAPRDMDTLFHQRISTMEAKLDDIRNEVQMAVSDVIEGVAKVTDLEDMGRELDGKASQLDIKQLAQQQAALAQSVNGMAEWLAVRPETSDGAKGTGASMTKFKCLTCDREIKTQAMSNGNATLKGNFLPRLDGMQAHSSSLPVGPGLNTAEMRRSVRAMSGSPTKGQDFTDYGALDDGRHSGKTTRTADGRVALQLPAGGLKMPPGPKAPVFVT